VPLREARWKEIPTHNKDKREGPHYEELPKNARALNAGRDHLHQRFARKEHRSDDAERHHHASPGHHVVYSLHETESRLSPERALGEITFETISTSVRERDLGRVAHRHNTHKQKGRDETREHDECKGQQSQGRRIARAVEAA
jgi:hypothetical protein